jgi:hypothetical protein
MALNNRTDQKVFRVGHDIGIIRSRVRVPVSGASRAIIMIERIGNRPPLAFWPAN